MSAALHSGFDYTVRFGALRGGYDRAVGALRERHDPTLVERIDNLFLSVARVDKTLCIAVFMNSHALQILSEAEWLLYIDVLERIAVVNPFVVGYILPKLEFLKRSKILPHILTFLDSVRHYNSRQIGYVIGSSDSALQDIEKVVGQCGAERYILIINELYARRMQLRSIAAYLLGSAGKYFRIAADGQLGIFLDAVIELLELYGSSVIVAILESCGSGFDVERLRIIRNWLSLMDGPSADKVAVYVQRDLVKRTIPSVSGTSSLVTLLRSDEFSLYDIPRDCLSDPIRMGLLRYWPWIEPETRENMLTQLVDPACIKRSWLASGIANEAARKTAGQWTGSWSFCRDELNIPNIRKGITELVGRELTKETLTDLVIDNPALFNRQNAYSYSRLIEIANCLRRTSMTDSGWQVCERLLDFLRGKPGGRHGVFTSSDLFFELWDRDPYFDYNRSNEVYTCTGLGDLGVQNAPLYLADPTIARLNVFLAGRIIGRATLVLVTDASATTSVMVDCVDGSDRLLRSRHRMNQVMGAIASFIEVCGFQSFYLNCEVLYNPTPKYFVEAALKRSERRADLLMFTRVLSSLEPLGSLPNPRLPFLESFGDGATTSVFTLSLNTGDWKTSYSIS